MAMNPELLMEWRNKLHSKVCAIPGVNGLRVNRTSLLVEVERMSPEVDSALMDVLEREGADEIPYNTKVVGRVVRL